MKIAVPVPTLDASDNAVSIASDAQTLLNGAEEIRQRTRLAIGEAARVGKRLTDEKEWVETTYGRGHWETYFDKHFGKVLASRTARHWMKLAAIAVSIKSYDTKKLQSRISAMEAPKDAKVIRIGMRSLEIGIPPAARATENEGPVNPGADRVIDIGTSHITYINHLIARVNRFRSEGKRQTPEKLNAFLKDFAPLLSLLQQLQAEAGE